MGLAEELGKLQEADETPRRLSVQTPSRSSFEAPKRPAVSTPKRVDAWAAKSADARAARRLDAQTPRRSDAKTAKYNDPDYSKKTLYLKTLTMRDAMRKYEDQGGKEESELVEMLLQRYIGG